MHLSPSLADYTKETLSARQAQRLAEFIAFGPIVFEACRLLVEYGILDALRDADEGLTIEESAEKASVSEYATRVLLEAGLSAGVVLVNPETDRFRVSKTGWFLLNDPATRVNMPFNHYVNYRGFYNLDEALREGRPAGLESLGDWPTIYEGLSSLPKNVQKAWFDFDHFYSDNSFEEALQIVFSFHPKRLLDVGGNTGRWALQCVGHDPDVRVTIADLPQQIGMMKQQTAGQPGADRIEGYGVNLLDEQAVLPSTERFDIVWMSQFLDCFGPPAFRARLVLPDDDQPLFHGHGQRKQQDVPFRRIHPDRREGRLDGRGHSRQPGTGPYHPGMQAQVGNESLRNYGNQRN